MESNQKIEIVKEWQQHPITKDFLRLIRGRIKLLTDTLAEGGYSQDPNATHVRVVSLCDQKEALYGIEEILTNAEVFVEDEDIAREFV